MNIERRKFIKLTGAATGALALNTLFADSLLAGCNNSEAGKLKNFGIQLWTLRDDLPKDPKGVLKQLASFGYKQIESFEGGKGIYWGMSNLEFKAYMDELGMSLIASHCDITKDFEKKAAEAAAIGMKYLICPWKGPQKSIDDFKKFADEFNGKGEICRKNGIRFAYHNHDYSFAVQDGQMGQDVMMKNTDSSLVDFEMDIYWVATAGQDPIAWFNKYPDRFRLCHIKDRSKSPVTDNGKNSVDLGTGVIDYSSVLKAAKSKGMEYFIVEQEAYPNGTPLEAVKVDAEYMKKVKV
ncbi:MAG: sugar phosphate isomerase/epimerase [Chitinophagaceae bacterium]